MWETYVCDYDCLINVVVCWTEWLIAWVVCDCLKEISLKGYLVDYYEKMDFLGFEAIFDDVKELALEMV